MVWKKDFAAPVGIIEVYPAATRLSLGAPKGAGSLRGLTSRLRLDISRPDSKDTGDAIVCALAGAEFLAGKTLSPSADQDVLAHREGWIWVADRVPAAKSERRDRRRSSSTSKSSSVVTVEDVVSRLSRPARLWNPHELLETPSNIDAERGVYAWYFRHLRAVPVEGCRKVDSFWLLYVGIAPFNAESDSTIQQRICENHLGSDASWSTLRKSLGCLLADELRITLQHVNGRLQFAEGEEKLSAWMNENARVAWTPHSTPWAIESAVIRALNVPLNIQHNRAHPFYGKLKALRARASSAARR